MKILEHKCFGVTNRRDDDTHSIIFKVDNGNYILLYLRLKHKTKMVNEVYYYTNEKSFNLTEYDDTTTLNRTVIDRLTENKEYLKVSYDEKMLVDEYFNKNNLKLIFRGKSTICKPNLRLNINNKCEINKIGFVGLINKNEFQPNKECEKHILVKFEIDDKIIVVNRVITSVNNERIDDEFFFTEREGWYDVPKYNPLSFSKNWLRKEEINNEYCDWLSYIHYGLSNIDTNIENEYNLGSTFITKSTYENDKFLNEMNEEDRLKYKTTNDIISEIDNRMVEMEKDKIY